MSGYNNYLTLFYTYAGVKFINIDDFSCYEGCEKALILYLTIFARMQRIECKHFRRWHHRASFLDARRCLRCLRCRRFAERHLPLLLINRQIAVAFGLIVRHAEHHFHLQKVRRLISMSMWKLSRQKKIYGNAIMEIFSKFLITKSSAEIYLIIHGCLSTVSLRSDLDKFSRDFHEIFICLTSWVSRKFHTEYFH